MTYFGSLCAGLLGLLIGSFLNVVILRLPRGETLWGRSACPRCGYQLRLLDLFPVLSYAFLKGKCRQCAGGISPRYPLIELLSAGLFFLSYQSIGPVGIVGYIFLLQAWLVVAVCLVTFVVDFEHYLILDKVTFGGLACLVVLKIVYFFAAPSAVWSMSSVFLSSILGVLVGVVPFFLLWFLSHGKWMGFGDVKFMLFAGVALGWPHVIVALLLAFWAGALFALPLLVSGKKSLGSHLPFGTFLAIGVVIAFLYGNSLWHWYISFLTFG